MSVMGFQKKSLDGAVGGVRSIQVFFFFLWNFFNFAKHHIGSTFEGSYVWLQCCVNAL